MTTPDDATADRPALRLVRGHATPEELAAVIAVLTARARGGGPDGGDAAEPDRSLWAQPRLRHSPADALPLTGPGRPQWRTSLRPR